MWVLQRGHSGDGCHLGSTLCIYLGFYFDKQNQTSLVCKVDEFHWCQIFPLLQVRQIGFPLPPLHSFFSNEPRHNLVLQPLLPDIMTKELHLPADNIIQQFLSTFAYVKLLRW